MIMKFKQEGRKKSGSYPPTPTSGVSPLAALFLPEGRTVTHGVQLWLGGLWPQLTPPPLLSLQSRGGGGFLLVSISGLPRLLPPICILGFSTLAGLRWGGSTSQGRDPFLRFLWAAAPKVNSKGEICMQRVYWGLCPAAAAALGQ